MIDLHKNEKNLRSSVDQILNAVNNVKLKNAASIQSVEKLTHAALMKLGKDALATLVEDLAKSLTTNIDLCKSAAGTLENLKTELIEVQKEQLQSVKNTVKTEMQSWSDIVKKNCSSAPTLKNMKKVVVSAVQDDARSRNFIIHGVPEDYSEYPGDVADEVLDDMWQHKNHPDVVAANFIGARKREDGRPRPIKVTFHSNESVKLVLAKAHNLKKSTVKTYHTWFISPDRNFEEQAAHQKLVAKLKDNIKADSTKFHYIKDGKVLSVDKS